MPQEIKKHCVLLSCPSDVYEACYSIVDNVIKNFNQMYGLTFGIEIRLIHWSTDSYPESGGKPQALLNRQIVDPVDAAIAIFWKKFGTPTDCYSSGTEEEIERLLAEKKQVFVYFFEKLVQVSELGNANSQEQYKKVVEFKNRYKDKGIYWTVSDEDELQKMLTLHLSKFFLEKIGNSLGSASQQQMIQSNLSVVTSDNCEEIFCNTLALSQNSSLLKSRNSIISNIREIVNNPLSPRSLESDPKTDYERQHKSNPLIHMINGAHVESFSANISASDQKLIEEFCTREKIDITPDIWNLGNLKQKSVHPLGEFDGGFIGTSAEKERFHVLSQTASAIRNYNNDVIFCDQIKKLPYIELAIKNDGTTFDEDVIVKLKFPVSSLLFPDYFPFPESNDYFCEERVIHSIICPTINSDVMKYTGYPNPVHSPKIGSLSFESSEERFQRRKASYYENIKRFYCYEIFTENEQEILVCKFKEVQQHTSILFPTRIFFKAVPSVLTYTIIGKHTPNVIEKTLNIHC